MSANIYYHQVKPIKGQEVPTYAPSSFMQTMERVFGDELPELDESDLPKLQALSDAQDPNNNPNPFRALVSGVKKYKTIQLYAEY